MFIAKNILWIFWIAIGIVPIAECRSAEKEGEKATRMVCLVKDAEAEAVIVISAEAGKSVRKSAKLLGHYISLSTSAKIPVENYPGQGDGGRIKIHIGTNAYVKSLRLNTDKLDMNGFIIAFPDEKNVVIVGGSDSGTAFGVYEFLERYLGVRWLFPGKLGEHVPKMRSLEIPRLDVREEPSFLSRRLSLGKSGGVWPWAYRNRMDSRIAFHHSLLRLFRPSKYTKTHPEFFPIYSGMRYLPKSDKDHNWQPDLSADGIVEEAVKNICAYFKKNPDKTSYSLGINDSTRFVPKAKRRNYLGREDYSDYYYEWANKVVEGVLKHYPNKWFGCLAYWCVAEPPKTFRVNGRIIPYLCYDRMKWANPSIASVDKAITKRWHKTVPVVGWYDYIYGDHFYHVPRVYFHLMADYLRWASENGVRHYYGEAYPDKAWIEGPKLYLTLKLLWDPHIDVDKVLKDWYCSAVGSEAAPHLKTYFDFWEDFWTNKVPRTGWFRRRGSHTWLAFNHQDYLAALRKADLVQCEAILKKVLANAGTDKQKERARFFLAGFEGIKKKTANHFKFAEMNQSPPPLTNQVILFASDFSFAGAEKPSKATTKQADWCCKKMPKGWSYWQRGTSKAAFVWDKATGHERSGSLMIDTKGSGRTPLCFLRFPLVQKGSIYHASCWVKTEGVPDEAVTGITLKWKDANLKWLGEETMRTVLLKNISNGQWQKIDIYCPVPPGAAKLVYQLYVRNSSQGKVWFDDVCLYEIKASR